MKDRTKLTRLWGVAFALLLTAACAGEEDAEVEVDVDEAPPAATMPPPSVGPAPVDSMAMDSVMDSVPR